MKKIWIVLLLTTVWLSACQPQAGDGIEVRDYWLRPAARGGNTAMYMLIRNRSAEPDVLVGAAATLAEAVEVHATKIDSTGTMQMSPVPVLPLEPGQDIIFEPGGLHVMLIGLRQDLVVGDQVQVTLQFTKHADLLLTVPVQAGTEGMNH